MIGGVNYLYCDATSTAKDLKDQLKMRHFTENCSNPDALYNKLNRLIIYSSNETMLFDDKKVFSELVKIGDMLHTGLKL